MTKTEQKLADERGVIPTFRVSPEVMTAVEATAACEGISKSAVARRALMRELAKRNPGHP
jgi:hypothetical protein